jgi:hypothetical protein
VYFEKYENLEVYIGNSTSREVYFRSFPFYSLGPQRVSGKISGLPQIAILYTSSPIVMAAAATAPSSNGNAGGRFQDKEKPQEVRRSNITAAKGPP